MAVPRSGDGAQAAANAAGGTSKLCKLCVLRFSTKATCITSCGSEMIEKDGQYRQHESGTSSSSSFTRTAHTKRQAHGMQGEYSSKCASPKPRGASPMHLVASCRRSRESEERRALVLFMMCSCACLARVEIKLASAAVVRAGIPAKKQAWSVTGSVPSANRWHGARMARAFPLGGSRARRHVRAANK